MVYDALGEAVHGSKGWLAGGGTLEAGPLRGVALLLALLGSRARPKNTAFLAIISKTGRFVVCFMKAQKKEKEVCWAAVVRPPPILFSVGCIGRMVRPVKGFQHRGMIPVLGPRAARRARKHTGGPGFDPRFGPRLFFCPLSLHYPKDPPMRPRSRAVPVSSISRGREADEAAVGTRDPRRSFADENERTEQPRKIQPPQKISPQSPQSPHLQSRRPPHNLR